MELVQVGELEGVFCRWGCGILACIALVNQGG